MNTPNSNAGSKYIYRALSSPTEIRLLVLRPGRKTDDVEFSLVHASLEYDAQYEAISYAWGDASVTCNVHCFGIPMRVTISLFTALRQLRYPDRIRTLWADAVCIDQENISEKGQQVRIMPEIYSRAERVLIWLGEEVDDLTGLKDTLNESFNIISYMAMQSGQDTSSHWKQAANNLQSSMEQGKQNLKMLNWTPIIQLIRNRGWFRRKWVIQELTLARDAIIHCGDIVDVMWEHLSCLVMLGVRSGILSKARIDDAQFEEGIRNFQTMIQLHFGLKAQRDCKLIEAVRVTRNFLCSDPRDHIFAVLSLASKVEREGHSIQPDYNQHYSDVFKNFALSEIIIQSNLTVLSLAGLIAGMDSSLPSWVPDLSKSTVVGTLATSGRVRYNAGGDKPSNIRVSKDGKMLHCRGKIIDSVEMLAPCLADVPFTPGQDCFADPRNISQLVEWFRVCKSMASNDASKISNGQYEVVAKCLVCELDGDGDRKATGFSTSFLNYETACEHILKNKVAPKASSELYLEAIVEIESALDMYGQPRRFFVGSSGRLGMLPNMAKPKDQICVIFGGEVPYVIRPTGMDSYQLVGECYVHGVMDGESIAFEEYKDCILDIE